VPSGNQNFSVQNELQAREKIEVIVKLYHMNKENTIRNNPPKNYQMSKAPMFMFCHGLRCLKEKKENVATES